MPVLARFWWQNAFKVPHALQKSQETQVWVCGFFVVWCMLTPITVWVFCMVNGLQASRSVDSQNMFEVGMVKSIGPSGQLRLGN